MWLNEFLQFVKCLLVQFESSPVVKHIDEILLLEKQKIPVVLFVLNFVVFVSLLNTCKNVKQALFWCAEFIGHQEIIILLLVKFAHIIEDSTDSLVFLFSYIIYFIFSFFLFSF